MKGGWGLFVTTIFVLVGAMDIIFGLTMLINNEWIVFAANEVWYLDLTAWGWITLIIGALAVLVAWGIYSGQTWARVLGLIAAVIAAINAFAIIPFYTVWGIAILAGWALVIWALAVHWDDVEAVA